ncbi:hypothetical protein [Sporomusa sp. KB1]|uniref:hypothetical protein n=1 Tax=Sporomusa sp. KB1 TaxID=943346 RepID=UPI0011A41381|nr:hypothetical protein [Sporomusa sp. KB1]TWH49586.1 hypothetical protein Salpa_5824 [Sporomusa sp. KB1]
MPAGLQCWDADGNLTLDITDRLTRVLGTIQTGTSDGSITDNNLLLGTPWYFTYYLDDNHFWRSRPLKISFSSNILSWAFISTGGNYQNTNIDTMILYGVY